MPNVLTSLIANGTARYGDREVFSFPAADGSWQPTSWNEFARMTSLAARAFASMGLHEQECVALFTQNRPEVLITDFAAYANRACPISIYSTSSLDQVIYIVRDCNALMLMVGDERQLAIGLQAMDMCPSLKHLIVLDPEVKLPETDERVMTFEHLLLSGADTDSDTGALVEARTAAATPEDLATIIYTSGTTGEPKGAMLPHSCFSAAIITHRERLNFLTEDDTAVCFLPLSHIFEKAWNYFCLDRGIRVSINPDPHAIQKTIAERRPSCMCSVPRFWEKVYSAIATKMDTMKGLRRMMIDRAIAVGRRRNLEYARRGLRAPLLLELQYRFFRRTVYKPVQRLIGVENGKIYPTAGAPLSASITEFFRSIGIPIWIGYGLSETTATVTCFPTDNYVIGSVGTTIPGVEVKIGPDNEILVKGPTVMSGYHGKPKETAEAFTADGWLRTGDAGRLDEGALYLTERIKDLFKTSNGKYIAPQQLESRLGEDSYIEQIALIGDQRKYVSALIVPNYDELRRYAAQHNLPVYSTDDLVKNEQIRRMMAERIEKRQADLAPYERIKKFTLLPEEFTMAKGEITNTLKIRRPVIYKNYAETIDKMYE